MATHQGPLRWSVVDERRGRNLDELPRCHDAVLRHLRVNGETILGNWDRINSDQQMQQISSDQQCIEMETHFNHLSDFILILDYLHLGVYDNKCVFICGFTNLLQKKERL